MRTLEARAALIDAEARLHDASAAIGHEKHAMQVALTVALDRINGLLAIIDRERARETELRDARKATKN